ncbi:MAG: PAS domain S-box protein, partial [Myxococcales bacterium]|nr:PAS domain S-box protein [Myxococcales bacterium]
MGAPNAMELVASALALVGMLVLAVALLATQRLIGRLGAHARRWALLRGLMLSFLVAYAGAIALILLGDASALTGLVGAVFLGGAVFVYLTIATSSATYAALEEVSVSAEHLESILDSMGDSLFVVSEAGEITACNQVLANSLGYRRGQLLGMPVDAVLDMEGDELAAFLEADEHCRVHTRLKTVWGMKIPVRLTRSTLAGVDARVCVAQDVGEQQGGEAAVREAARDLSARQGYERVIHAQLASALEECEQRGVADSRAAGRAVEALRHAVEELGALADRG